MTLSHGARVTYIYIEKIETQIPDFQYTGIDVVPSIIQHSEEKYRLKKNWHFHAMDFTTRALPHPGRFDLIMSRDVFFHLTIDKIMCGLNFFSASGSKYFVTTTHKNVDNFLNAIADKSKNAPETYVPLNAGGYRPIDVMAVPFLFPKPLRIVEERNDEAFMGLWKLPLPLYAKNQKGEPLSCS